MVLCIALLAVVSNSLCSHKEGSRRGGDYEASFAPYQTPRVDVKKVGGPHHDGTLFSIMTGNSEYDHYIQIPFAIAQQIALFQSTIAQGKGKLPNESEQSLKLVGEYIKIRADINKGVSGAKQGMVQWGQRLSQEQDRMCTLQRFQNLVQQLYQEKHSLGLLTLPILKLGSIVPHEEKRNKKLTYITSMGRFFTLPLQEAQSIWGSKIATPGGTMTDPCPISVEHFWYVANYVTILQVEKDLPKLEVFVAGIPEIEAPNVKAKLTAMYQGQRLPGFHPTFYEYATEELQSFLKACKERKTEEIQAILLRHKIAVFGGIAALLGSIYLTHVQLTK